MITIGVGDDRDEDALRYIIASHPDNYYPNPNWNDLLDIQATISREEAWNGCVWPPPDVPPPYSK